MLIWHMFLAIGNAAVCVHYWRTSKRWAGFSLAMTLWMTTEALCDAAKLAQAAP
jgi:hypothetical protein